MPDKKNLAPAFTNGAPAEDGMSPEDWKRVENAMAGTFGSIKLDCDGYEVHLVRGQVSKNRLGIMVYVNGWIKGEWLSNECEERRRFFRRVERYLWNAKQRADMKKTPAKIRKELGFGDPDKKFVAYAPDWTSFAKLRAHLKRENENIRLLEVP